MRSAGFDLSQAEVEQLWWLSDGAIMNPDTRRRLPDGWGLCTRHSWAYFVIECELRWQPWALRCCIRTCCIAPSQRVAAAPIQPGPGAQLRGVPGNGTVVTAMRLASTADHPLMASTPWSGGGTSGMAKVGDDEVLLLWRALTHFRTGRHPACAARGKRPSPCPLHHTCPRWAGPDDDTASLEETIDQIERRRSSWPCSRLLDLLGPEVRAIGR